jgi:D-alanyl-D-alanine carboxypeptidase/D-alanyl-D-alanine-endopeptidase (penicillin-binding protein 4)
MIKSIFFLLLLSLSFNSRAQTAATRLKKAYEKFESDGQLTNALSSLYVVDAASGEVIFDRNSRTGMPTASTMKVITSATAYELLGKDFHYVTLIGYDKNIRNGELPGNLYVTGSGDPTFGSPRWKNTSSESILNRIYQALHSHGISRIKGDIWIDDTEFGINPVPDGWIWQDIGNYYGAGSSGLNWRENQYDLLLRSAAPGDVTEMLGTDPVLYDFRLSNLIKAGKTGSGDNGYIYYTPYSNRGFATGTIPPEKKEFRISGSLSQPAKQFGFELRNFLAAKKISVRQPAKTYSDLLLERKSFPPPVKVLDSIVSPPLDSINYWFPKKSINLYGETLLKTFAWKQNGTGDTDNGADIVKDFWEQRGIPPTELNQVDGSGLSPLNRVTTHAQVMVLHYARKQSWFPGYFYGFPEYNGMKMKSGTINGVKGFCGYQVSKDGHEYIFSFLVNNYKGSASALVKKMYEVLDELK